MGGQYSFQRETSDWHIGADIKAVLEQCHQSDSRKPSSVSPLVGPLGLARTARESRRWGQSPIAHSATYAIPALCPCSVRSLRTLADNLATSYILFLQRQPHPIGPRLAGPFDLLHSMSQANPISRQHSLQKPSSATVAPPTAQEIQRKLGSPTAPLLSPPTAVASSSSLSPGSGQQQQQHHMSSSVQSDASADFLQRRLSSASKRVSRA